MKAQQIQGVGEPILGVMAKKIEGKEKLWDEGFLAMDARAFLKRLIKSRVRR